VSTVQEHLESEALLLPVCFFLVDKIDSMSATVDDLTEDFDRLAADPHTGQHPELRNMCVMNCANSARIVPNGPPVVLDNECFEGKVMLLIRTPDVDNAKDPHISTLAETPSRISTYFKGKKRRFEFQFQIKLKHVPQGPLFLGCELENSIKIGTITKGLVGILLAMVRRINPGFHFAWGPDNKTDASAIASGDYEKTHISFPVEASMDRIVISKAGEDPPTLGHELFETNESVKRRRKMGAGSVDWNTSDTYTMCLWSAYADWIKWKSLNVPGVSPFLFSRVTGKQPIYLSVYEIDNISPSEYRRKKGIPHTRKDLRVYTRLEFSHVDKTIGGLADSILKKPRSSVLSSEQSLPDTESVDSDFEVASRVTT
jgi:hypothetical protein